MFIKVALVLILIQIAADQIFARGQVLTAPDAAVETQHVKIRKGQKLTSNVSDSQFVQLRKDHRLLSDELQALDSQFVHLREGQRLLSDELHVVETNMLERIKDLLCTGCKTNTTTTTPTTTTTTEEPKTKRRTCKEWLQDEGKSGTYLINPSSTSNLSFEAYCLLKKDPNETTFWTVILRRQDGTVDFSRKWKEYQRGFGNLHGEFILGLDYIHALTESAQHELWIEIELKNGKKGWARYGRFLLGNSTESYKLKYLGHYSGTAGDALSHHSGMKWSTKDEDNDVHSINCAESHGGGWWFRDCMRSCLTGQYEKYPQIYGTYWSQMTPYKSFQIKYAQMAIREIE